MAIPCQAKGEPLPSRPPCAATVPCLTWPCPLQASPPPEMAWYKDAALIRLEKLSRFQLLADGSLQISGLVPDDTGMFQCFARNAAGEVQTTTYLAVTSRCQPPPSGAQGALPGQWVGCAWDTLAGLHGGLRNTRKPSRGDGTPPPPPCPRSGSAPGWPLGRASGGAVHLSTPQASPPTSPGVPRTAQ